MALTSDKEAPDPKSDVGDGPALKTHTSVADTLRLVREEHGQNLRTVAEVLRIRYDYLKAIESGAFDRLPGTTYVYGFLRTYAEFLGIDGHEIVERFKREEQGSENKPELVFPEPVNEGRIPSGAIILLFALLLGVTYGGWIYLSNQDRSIADLIPSLPKRLQEMIAGEEDRANERASVEQPAGSEPAQEFAQPAPESDAPSIVAGPADAAEEFAGDPAVAFTPEDGAVNVIVAEAPADATVADFESDAEAAVAPEAPAEDSAVEATPAATLAASEPPSEPAAAQPEAPDAQTARAEFADPAPAMSTPGESMRPAPPVPEAEDMPSEPAPAERPAAPAAQMPGGYPSMGRSTAMSPLMEQTVVIPSPPSVPQALPLSNERSPRVYGESTERTRIVLRALRDSWVQIRDRQDALLLTRVLRAGDSYFVPAQEGLTLLTGNAGGLEIEVDGVKIPPLGPIGAVRRQIVLDPARLLSTAAVPR